MKLVVYKALVNEEEKLKKISMFISATSLFTF